MIFELLLAIPSIIFNFLLSLFPISDGVPASFTEAVSAVGSYMKWFNNFFPLDTFLNVLLIVLGVEIVIALAKIFGWFGGILTGRNSKIQ